MFTKTGPSRKFTVGRCKKLGTRFHFFSEGPLGEAVDQGKTTLPAQKLESRKPPGVLALSGLIQKAGLSLGKRRRWRFAFQGGIKKKRKK